MKLKPHIWTRPNARKISFSPKAIQWASREVDPQSLSTPNLNDPLERRKDPRFGLINHERQTTCWESADLTDVYRRKTTPTPIAISSNKKKQVNW